MARNGLLAIALAFVLISANSLTAVRAEGPAFTLGFRSLADAIPSVVGLPLEDEHHSSVNGDSLQQTTTGLMVWRKADNWTAFTNGWWTWVNGPNGVQSRSNDLRFDWEPPLEAATAAPPGSRRTPTAEPRAAASPTSTPWPTRTARPTATPVPNGVRSANPSGEWVTSVSSNTRYYCSLASSYWKTWSAGNRIWFATEADLLRAYPDRVKRE